ncbi:MAG: response regulator [Candidatus Pacebacteria bacterium]|nr:response regulator [Candidatus Paceibacterota bacterium]MDD5357099.1 response regulator [Candidatus Paceibacterota bacterium]
MDKDKTYKLLIVDDDKFLLDMYCMKFKKGNFDVHGASSGADALTTLKGGFIPDILILDLVMPTMSGFQLLETVKKEHIADKAVVVVLTNQGQSPDIEKAKSMGVDGYIVKASTIPSEVVEQVVKIFSEKKK